MKDKFTFFPDRTTSIPEALIPEYASEISIKTADGESLQAFLFRKDRAAVRRSLLIYFHGNAGNLYSRFDSARKLMEMDQDVLLVSYRGYAKSTGAPTEEGIYEDGRSAITYAQRELGYQEQEIVLFGRSLGSTVAVHNAQGRNFKCVILITPLTSGREMAVAMGLGILKFVAGNSYNSLEKINRLQSPLLIVHGDRDEVVPYHMGEQLYNQYQGPKHMTTIERGSHNDLTFVNPDLYWGEIEKFLKDVN